MTKRNRIIFAFAIILIALFVRVYRLADVPASLFSDELDMGIQARSLLETGRDYRGALSPFYVRSYNADRTPLPIWLTMISTAVFNDGALQVRMAPAIEGVVIVGLSMVVMQILTGSALAGMLAGVVFALSPWQIQFSRIGFEAASLGVVYLLGLVCFFKWIKFKKIKWLYLSVTLIALSIYTYRTMTLFAPLTFLALTVIYLKEWWLLKTKDKLLTVMLALTIMGSFIYATTFAASDQLRINQISIFSDKTVPIWVQRNREIDSGDLTNPIIGNQASAVSKFFHNKPLSWYTQFKDNYIEALSGGFLFLWGDPDLRQSTGRGLLLTLDLLPLVIGVYWLLKNRQNKAVIWLMAWLLLSPIPSSLTTDGGGGHHATRLFILGIPLLFCISLGWWQIAGWLIKKRLGVAGVVVLALYMVNFSVYYHHYLNHYPLESAKFFGYGYKQALDEIKIESSKHQYKVLKLTTTLDPPLPYFWFWNNTPARDIQARGLAYGGEIAGIGQIEASNRTTDSAIEKGNLYLLAKDDLPLEWRNGKFPKDVRLISTIFYPDQQPVLFILTRD